MYALMTDVSENVTASTIDPEDGGDRLLRKVNGFRQDNAVSSSSMLELHMSVAGSSS